MFKVLSNFYKLQEREMNEMEKDRVQDTERGKDSKRDGQGERG
jgi:hypothetical protein